MSEWTRERIDEFRKQARIVFFGFTLKDSLSALDEIERLQSDLKAAKENTDAHLAWMAEQGNIITGLRSEISDLKAELAKFDWIPVTVSPPELSGAYLVTIEADGKRFVDIRHYEKDYGFENVYGDIIAWMNVPVSYYSVGSEQ